MELPDRISTAIADKRNSSNAGEQPNTPEAPKPVETPVTEKKPEEKPVATPEPKKDEAPKPKPGQSIAQIAETTTIGDDDDDDDDPDDETPTGEKKSNGRGSIFSEFKTVRRELKNVKRDNASMAEMIAEIPKLVAKIEELTEGLKPSQKIDKLEEFAEKNDLDPASLKELASILGETLVPKTTPKAKDDEPEKKPENKKTVDAEMQLRKVELAIENEYDDYIDSFPQAKGKLNLKAIKQYILSDKENLTKSFSDIVDAIYPGLLTNKAGTDGGSSNQTVIEDDEKVDWKDPKIQERMKTDEKLRTRYKVEFKEKAKNIFKS